MRRGDLFVLSWESLRRVEWGKVSSFLSMLWKLCISSYFAPCVSTVQGIVPSFCAMHVYSSGNCP